MGRKRRDPGPAPRGPFRAGTWRTFVHLDIFEEGWAALGLGDADLNALQLAILEGPERHPVIPGSGGLRKVRYAPIGSGKGKRGGCRVDYVYFKGLKLILLVTAWGKGEKVDLSQADLKALATVIRAVEQQLKARQAP